MNEGYTEEIAAAIASEAWATGAIDIDSHTDQQIQDVAILAATLAQARNANSLSVAEWEQELSEVWGRLFNSPLKHEDVDMIVRQARDGVPNWQEKES